MKTILVTRAQMERCGRALTKKTFLCPKCLAPMTHDETYKHWGWKCPARKPPVHRE
jgi:hypothetical protein